MPILECNNLTKTYAGVTALDHIDLAIDPGRIVGLLGPNGSGKTTLIKLAAGLLQPTQGQILIDGKKPSPETNAVLSYLPERIALSQWMKVTQVLDFFCDFYKDFDRAAAEAGINPNTVQRAFSELEREGLMYTQRATGKYVTENADEIKSARQALAKTQVAEFLSNMQSLGYSVGDVIVLLQSFNESEEENKHADSGM